MGYTHYWRRNPKLNNETFSKASADVQKVVEKLSEMGLDLAGPMGDGTPVISNTTIAFNGREKCGHKEQNLGIAWPAPKAGGMSTTGPAVAGQWFAGTTLAERSCGGDCAHESFFIESYEPLKDYEKKEGTKQTFNFCKTAFKPYDLAVISALIILKHHFGKALTITSDGTLEQWRDGIMVCQMVLGYGITFKLDSRG